MCHLNSVSVRAPVFSFLGKQNLRVGGQVAVYEPLKHSWNYGCLLRKLWMSTCRKEKDTASWGDTWTHQQLPPAPQRTLEMKHRTSWSVTDQSLGCVILWRPVRQAQKRPDGRRGLTAVGCLLTVHTANGSEFFWEGSSGPHARWCFLTRNTASFGKVPQIPAQEWLRVWHQRNRSTFVCLLASVHLLWTRVHRTQFSKYLFNCTWPCRTCHTHTHTQWKQNKTQRQLHGLL